MEYQIPTSHIVSSAFFPSKSTFSDSTSQPKIQETNSLLIGPPFPDFSSSCYNFPQISFPIQSPKKSLTLFSINGNIQFTMKFDSQPILINNPPFMSSIYQKIFLFLLIFTHLSIANCVGVFQEEEREDRHSAIVASEIRKTLKSLRYFWSDVNF